MKTKILTIIPLFVLAAFSCQKEDNDPIMEEWLIPTNEIRDGGPGKDGISALTNPAFILANAVNYLADNDLILGFADGEDVRAYPHNILDWHEIVNDDTPNHSLSVIYCPLTGTGIGWDRMINGKKTTFGVSGLLYNSNIIPYDRETDSNWSQLLLQSVNGKLMGTLPKTYNLVETTWGTWKSMYPASRVVSNQTGHNRNYRQYPYGNYKESNNLIFPVSNSDNRLHPKQRVLGIIISEKAKAYPISKFSGPFSLVNDTFSDKNLVIAGNAESNIMVAFERNLPDGTKLTFHPVHSGLPAILTDNEGTTWDIFGRGINGPRTGQQLQTVPQMMGYWFAFAAFYPDLTIM